MLYDNDIALVEKSVTLGFRDQDSCNAWERIKNELVELAQLSHNKPSVPVCPHYSREMVKSSEYVEFDICTCRGNTGKPAHVG